MKIVTVCWARNECDILEAFVRHHAQWSDIFITLHRTRDNSADILRALRNEGLPVSWIADERLHHEQADVINALVQHAAQEAHADWILPLDADEFLVGDVLGVLQHANTDVPVAVPWRTYIPLPNDHAAERNVLRRITRRHKAEPREWKKVLIPGELMRAHDCRVGFGNHELYLSDGTPVPAQATTLGLAHFPVRSTHQILRKIFGGWLSYRSMPGRQPEQGFHWKALYEELKDKQTLTAEDLQRIAETYAAGDKPHDEPALVHDPIPATFDITHPQHDADPWNVLQETSDAFAARKKQAASPHEA